MIARSAPWLPQLSSIPLDPLDIFRSGLLQGDLQHRGRGIDPDYSIAPPCERESDDPRTAPKVDDCLSADLFSNAKIEVGLRPRLDEFTGVIDRHLARIGELGGR